MVQPRVWELGWAVHPRVWELDARVVGYHVFYDVHVQHRTGSGNLGQEDTPSLGSTALSMSCHIFVPCRYILKERQNFYSLLKHQTTNLNIKTNVVRMITYFC